MESNLKLITYSPIPFEEPINKIWRPQKSNQVHMLPQMHESRTTTMPSDPITSLATLSYPRTGKRGVPQQFPRRLYEMLEGEAKLAEDCSDDIQFVIAWSESGKAFRIRDVELFATTVLPRYFRTKKFSSFQRNLNLVSFLTYPNILYIHNSSWSHNRLSVWLHESASGA